jgi:hypothetical protein
MNVATLCYVGGPKDGWIEPLPWEGIRIDDHRIVPIADAITTSAAGIVGSWGETRYHLYRVDNIAGPFALLEYEREITPRQVAELMPRLYEWDVRRGLVYKPPLEDRRPE